VLCDLVPVHLIERVAEQIGRERCPKIGGKFVAHPRLDRVCEFDDRSIKPHIRFGPLDGFVVQHFVVS
jgi:hypothetical protein